MAFMKKSDVQSLANLARLDLTDEELELYSKNLTEILSFVDKLNEVKTDEANSVESAAVRNVFREDVDPHDSGKYTDVILREVPESKDGFIKVKKILNTNDSQ